MTIEQTLADREDRYGRFVDHARLSQHLAQVMHTATQWDDLPSIVKESLEMIQHKVARILNGDPYYLDSWHDIAGYATLVEQHLEEIKPLTQPVSGTHWACDHGGEGKVTDVKIGDACPVCYSIWSPPLSA